MCIYHCMVLYFSIMHLNWMICKNSFIKIHKYYNHTTLNANVKVWKKNIDFYSKSPAYILQPSLSKLCCSLLMNSSLIYFIHHEISYYFRNEMLVMLNCAVLSIYQQYCASNNSKKFTSYSNNTCSFVCCWVSVFWENRSLCQLFDYY